MVVGIVKEVVQAFKIGGVMVVMVVDSTKVGMGIWIITEMDCIGVIIVSEN